MYTLLIILINRNNGKDSWYWEQMGTFDEWITLILIRKILWNWYFLIDILIKIGTKGMQK